MDEITTQTVITDIEEPTLDFIESMISKFQSDEKREFMLTAQNYYKNKNEIENKKREYIDNDGNNLEAKLLSNSKLAHPFFRKIINQKISYLLSKKFTVNSTDENYTELLNSRFDYDFCITLKNSARDAIINGVGWIQTYYDIEGVLKHKRINPYEIFPFWEDNAHTKLQAILRIYPLIQYDKDGEETKITKIEYYTTNGVWYYIEDDDGLRIDDTQGQGVNGNFTVMTSDGRAEKHVWDKIPFTCVKYTFDEVSLLQLIKPLLDDYDKISSSTSDNIQDIPNSVKVVTGAGATDKEEFAKNLATFNAIFLLGEASVSTLETRLDISTVDAHLNRLRADMYDVGNAVDMQEHKAGNKSGEALKFIFADLDMDTESFAEELQSSFQNLGWFIKNDALRKGEGDFTESEFSIVFNKDIAINEIDAMELCVKAQGINGISQRTILANVPIVEDVDKEMEQAKEEEEEYSNDLDRFRNMQKDEESQKELIDSE